MNKKPIVVICFGDRKNQSLKFNDLKYFRSYRDLCAKLEKQNINTYIAKGNNHRFLGNMTFKSVASFIKNTLVDTQKPIKANLAFLRTSNWQKNKKPIYVLNQLALIEICKNKLKTYRLLKKYMPKTYPINPLNFHTVINKITTSKVVIKPINGNGGTDVYVMEKSNINVKIKKIIKRRKCLAQEFVDTKEGIANMVDGYHDLRIINFSGELCFGYIRQPKKNLVSNIARHGQEKIIPFDKIPDSAKEICKEIDKNFIKFGPRIYSIDMGFEKGKPKIFELNSYPGMPFYEYNLHSKYYDVFHDNIVRTIKQALALNQRTNSLGNNSN